MTELNRAPQIGRLGLQAGILREPDSDDGHLILWVPGGREGSSQLWHRVSIVPGAKIIRRAGLHFVTATATPFRQLERARFGRLLEHFFGDGGNRDWLIPNGEVAEQYGDRRTDVVVVWAEEQETPPSEMQIGAHWPEAVQVQPLGARIWLVWNAREVAAQSDSVLPDMPSLDDAQRLLARARENGDCAAQVTALADLGLLALEHRDLPRALPALNEALALARSAGDRGREGDVLGILGLAGLAAKDLEGARQNLAQALAIARSLGDRYAEKVTLERLSAVCAATGDFLQSLELLSAALALARDLDDRAHAADLLWHMAVRHAEAGRREDALSHGQAAVELLERLGNPQAQVYREDLERFRHAVEEPGVDPNSRTLQTVSTALPFDAPPAQSASERRTTALNYLRMAVSAAKGLSRFIASGLKTVDPQTLAIRREQCSRCAQYTGLRCRVCGCYTNLKLRLPYEQCPLHLWQSVEAPSQLPHARRA
ncbi:MAG: hypothetical protein ACLQNE_44765 [Thermoguttaceae bacterium]